MSEEMQSVVELPVNRDEYGEWTHPAWPQDGEDSELPHSWFAENGLEFNLVTMENDGPEELVALWFEGLADNCRSWQPTKPHGDGWFIFSIHDTEDGPVCVWVRRSTGGLVTFAMKKHKHTPGPWRPDGPDDFNDFNILHQGDALAVAAVISNMRELPEVEANAKLIAAAPDLLAAAKRVLAKLDHPTNRVTALDADALRAAIAKATE